MNNLLEINHLSKSYYTENGEILAIKDISLKVYECQFISIVGTSGCGKSTLLNILASLEDKSTGEVNFTKKLKIGYMLQEDGLLPYLTVFENATIGLKLLKIYTEDNKKYVENLLNTYGLKDFINKYPRELSGGMKQRVG